MVKGILAERVELTADYFNYIHTCIMQGKIPGLHIPQVHFECEIRVNPGLVLMKSIYEYPYLVETN